MCGAYVTQSTGMQYYTNLVHAIDGLSMAAFMFEIQNHIFRIRWLITEDNFDVRRLRDTTHWDAILYKP